MKINKPISLPVIIVLNIITVILSVTTIYFTGNASQDKEILKNKTNIELNAKSIKETKTQIDELKRHTIILDGKFDPVQIALIKQSLQLLKEDVKSIKDDQKVFMRQQNRFYQKVSAKLGITFN